MKTGVFIQARFGSKRLPGKILKKIYKQKTLLEIVFNRIQKALPEIPIIIATSKKTNDDKICDFAKENNLKYYRGSESNVLKRFIDAADRYNITNVIRVCADNPFIDVPGLKILKDYSEYSNSDYTAYCIDEHVPSIKTHYGLWGEVVKLSTLKKIDRLTNKKSYLEHVTKYIYENVNQFDISYLAPPKYMTSTKVRLTLDTKADLEVIRDIYSNVEEDKIFDTKEIIKYIKQQDRLLKYMHSEIKRNSK